VPIQYIAFTAFASEDRAATSEVPTLLEGTNQNAKDDPCEYPLFATVGVVASFMLVFFKSLGPLKSKE
jgi:hypothetical protein